MVKGVLVRLTGDKQIVDDCENKNRFVQKKNDQFTKIQSKFAKDKSRVIEFSRAIEVNLQNQKYHVFKQFFHSIFVAF